MNKSEHETIKAYIATAVIVLVIIGWIFCVATIYRCEQFKDEIITELKQVK